ncbi:hypothetical protein E3N88_17325 [Mikania micrantha]|uniref:Uncharacterized protein n=1 Tax=Mikania micrantha TaxID=192012 RepID=A0A5N6NSY5_9ASTR|nr:hypothetical protein E3N88_17325 [Mikania micrantha]
MSDADLHRSDEEKKKSKSKDTAGTTENPVDTAAADDYLIKSQRFTRAIDTSGIADSSQELRLIYRFF